MAGNPIKITGIDEGDPLPPPLLGQHTEEVLRAKLGLDDESVAALKEEGAIKSHQSSVNSHQ
jgi:crotonobetainyl-CoA:carnitine CoA-transferase CaiB-like acyl-CoA transferase